jgi:hypothetical protein
LGAFSFQSLNLYEPTVEDIIEKAKQLCRLDGMLWSNLGSGLIDYSQNMTAAAMQIAEK